MERQAESWQLRSGTWYRDPESETWDLAASPHGAAVDVKLPAQDVRRMIGARRDASTGQWFPSDFNYSPRTGAPLQDTSTCLDPPWIPPFGAPTLPELVARPMAGGLRQTPARLSLARSTRRPDPASGPDSTLPALPPGQYRFLVHKFDVASSILMAIEPDQGSLLVLLPESKIWIPLRPAGAILAQGLTNFRGWRMEVAEGARRATLYLPTAGGLAAVTPTLFGLSYAVEYFGEGPALGGPVAWAGEVWLPVLGTQGAVNLVGASLEADETVVLPTSARAPKEGFEAPVFDPLHVIWPSEAGQLIVRLNQTGRKKSDWIAWPDGLRPTFSLGCPLLFGSFWQQCWNGQNESFEYVQMGKLFPQSAAMDAPRLCTGRVSYRNEQRIEGDPSMQPEHAFEGTSSTVVLPLIESEPEGVVAGLRIDAPQGVLALLESHRERHRAVLQLQAEGRVETRFGSVSVTKPWLTSLFVYDGHLWVYHPELSQAQGWKLERRDERAQLSQGKHFGVLTP